MSPARLRLEHDVLVDLVTRSAAEVPGVHQVAQGGPPWRRLVAGAPVRVVVRNGAISVRVVIVGRSGERLGALCDVVRQAVAAGLERVVDVEIVAIDVVVDGVGG